MYKEERRRNKTGALIFKLSEAYFTKKGEIRTERARENPNSFPKRNRHFRFTQILSSAGKLAFSSVFRALSPPKNFG